jgi:xanthine dehydrogenase molybdopterin-binding subunit B
VIVVGMRRRGGGGGGTHINRIACHASILLHLLLQLPPPLRSVTTDDTNIATNKRHNTTTLRVSVTLTVAGTLRLLPKNNHKTLT